MTGSPVRVAAIGLLLGLLTTGLQPGLASADSLTWSITADRSTVPIGVSTQVTLTVTVPLVDPQPLLNCVTVRIPTVYKVTGWSASDSRGSSYPWTTTFASATLTARDSNDLLGLGELSVASLVLRVTVTGQNVSQAKWSGTAFDRNDCQHNPSPAPAISMAIVGALPTPTPVPTPTPTATPGPTPTAAPTPTPTPTPGRSARPSPNASGRPSSSASPGPTGLPVSSPSPSPSAVPSASDGGAQPSTGAPSPGAGTFSGGTGSGGGPIGSPELGVVSIGGSALNFSDAGFGSGLGAFAWTVPGYVLGLSGLLVLVILGVQMAGAALFVPFTRRVFGNSRRRGNRPGRVRLSR